MGFGVLSFVVFLLSQVPVDDRGEALPQNPGGMSFQAVYLEARSILTGDDVTSRNVSIFDAHGLAVVIYGLIPLVILAVVFIVFRRSPSSRPLTIGMLALAVLFLFGGGMTFLPSLIALAVASFQARRAEIPARMAERAAAQQEADDDADDEYDEEEDEYLDEDDEEDEYLDEDEEYDEEEGDVEDEDVDVDEEDEAMLADEADEADGDVTDAEAAEGEDEAVEQAPTRGRRKR